MWRNDVPRFEASARRRPKHRRSPRALAQVMADRFGIKQLDQPPQQEDQHEEGRAAEVSDG